MTADDFVMWSLAAIMVVLSLAICLGIVAAIAVGAKHLWRELRK